MRAKGLLSFALVLSTIIAKPAQELSGNWYADNVDSITYTNFGDSGSYEDVTDIASCAKTTFTYEKAPSAPLNDEVTVAIRGPIRLKQFAAYAPSTNTKSKRSSEYIHGHRHVRLHEQKKRSEQVMSYTSDGQVIVFTADPATWFGGGGNAAKVAGSSTTSTSSAAKPDPSESSEEVAAGDWTCIGSYTADGPHSSGLVFLKSVFAPMTYMSADGCSTTSSPQDLKDVLVPSNQEFTIWTNKECSGPDDCGYYDPKVSAYHGFDGPSKAFIFEFSMPDDPDAGQPSSTNLNPNMPSIWLLNSKIPRTAQYGCNCARGCGEFDLFEVLSNTNENGQDTSCMMKSTFYSQKQSLGSSDYFQRPTDGTVKGAVIMSGYSATVALLPDDFEITHTLTSDQISRVVSSIASGPSAGKTALP